MSATSFFSKESVIDAIIAAIAIVVIATLMYTFDAFEALYEFTQRHEDWELDEYILMVFAAPFPMLWYGYRRANQAERYSQEKIELEADLAHLQKIQSLGTLAGGLAHELNNQLVPMLGVTEVMLDSMDDNDPDRSKLELIIDGANRAKGTVETILKFSRQEDNDAEFCKVDESIPHLKSIMKISCPSSIKLNLSFVPPIGTVRLRNEELEGIIVNIFNNAVHAIDGMHGSIEVDIRREDQAGAGPNAKICVSDSGAGMTPELKDRIFDPFFTTKEVGKGTGLGMALVMASVQKANGTISVDSEQGKGTSITVRLPLESDI